MLKIEHIDEHNLNILRERKIGISQRVEDLSDEEIFQIDQKISKFDSKQALKEILIWELGSEDADYLFISNMSNMLGLDIESFYKQIEKIDFTQKINFENMEMTSGLSAIKERLTQSFTKNFKDLDNEEQKEIIEKIKQMSVKEAMKEIEIWELGTDDFTDYVIESLINFKEAEKLSVEIKNQNKENKIKM